jgi:hypothetical protein
MDAGDKDCRQLSQSSLQSGDAGQPLLVCTGSLAAAAITRGPGGQLLRQVLVQLIEEDIDLGVRMRVGGPALACVFGGKGRM